MLALAAVVVGVFGGPEPSTSAASSIDRPARAALTTLGSPAAGRSHVMQSATASYYLPTGNRTSCGRSMTMTSWHVAALKRDSYRCGDVVVICHARRCATVTVQDRGAWRSDNRRWDLTPRVRAALRCSDLCNVRWRKVSR